MKICIVKSKRVPDDLNTSMDGGSINFVEVIKEIEKHNKYSVTVITRNEIDNTILSESIVRNIRIIYLPFEYSESKDVMVRDFEEGMSFTDSLNRHLSQYSYDILYTHHWTSAIGLRILKAHWVHTPHLLAYAKKKYVNFFCPEYIIEKERDILKCCSKIIALSCSEKNDIITKYNIETEKIAVIPNGVSDLFFEYQSGEVKSKKEFIISTVARITKQKRLDIIIRAVHNLVQVGFNIKLKIIGGDYYDGTYFEYIQEQIRIHRLECNVEILGFISQAKIKSIYQESVLYIQSSYYESQGIAIIEAMAAGLPVITTYQDALNEYFVDGENGYLYNGDSVNELTKKIKIILINPALRNKISNHNISRSKAFRWWNTTAQTLKVLNPNEENSRNSEMLRTAFNIGHKISELKNTKNIAIAGSIAKGTTWSGSDVDLICISDDHKKEDFFSYSEVNVNIHYRNIDKTKAILNASSIHKQTTLLFEDYFSEYLWRAIPLFQEDSLIGSVIQLNASLRQTREVKEILIKEYISQASLFLNNSIELKNQKHFIQATIELRNAILFLVIAFKIQKGWIVQGSKKRPEQLKILCKSKSDFELFNFFIDSNNLNLDLNRILKFTNIRQNLRIKYMNLLKHYYKKGNDNLLKLSFIENEIKHNKNLGNYYLSNLYNCYELGAIYHIRQISGFKSFLNKVYYLTNDKQEPIADNIVPNLDKGLADDWLMVMGLVDLENRLEEAIPKTNQFISNTSA